MHSVTFQSLMMQTKTPCVYISVGMPVCTGFCEENTNITEQNKLARVTPAPMLSMFHRFDTHKNTQTHKQRLHTSHSFHANDFYLLDQFDTGLLN